MDYATMKTEYVCGVDLHSQSMYICVMNQQGEIKLHRNMRNDFNLFKQLIAAYNDNIAVGGELPHTAAKN